MAKKIRLNLNRVEGDLELELSLGGGRVEDAWCIGTLYRGFEQIMINRAPMDSLAITPRVCGICGTAHLMSAVHALEKAFSIPVPPNATRIRNLCLMAEEVQSDCRQTFLMFCIDLCHPAYAALPGFPETLEAFEELKGRIYRQTVQHSKKILEIVALFGGQWPHSSYMVPGGVTALPSLRPIGEAESIVETFISWYEEAVLGGTLEAWLEVRTAEDFEAWISEPSRAASALAVFTRACRAIGLHQVGAGVGLYLSYGAHPEPEKWMPPYTERACLRSPGLFDASDGSFHPFDQALIAEDISHSWYHDRQEAPKHPFLSETLPKYKPDGDRYTWAKAPRYGGRAVQTGPLAQFLVLGDPLIHSLLKQHGASAWLRQLVRFHRPVSTLLAMRDILRELASPALSSGPYILPARLGEEGEGFGLVEAARGSLGHWVRIKEGRVAKYQIVAPTTWNASPRDRQGRRGHWEESLIGLPVESEENPLLVGHVIRSHDPCLVCTVHFVQSGRSFRFGG
ncbi:MAG: nickel-dependent hydrogenase large subunit [Rhodospirillales bacterium]|jgi:hydrogenase large subunit|nr:nickel-dependent hydrogenase large subunit [Rhodospirillales bacterium]